MSDHYNSEEKSKGGLKPIHAIIPAILFLAVILFFLRPSPKEPIKPKSKKTAVVKKNQDSQKAAKKPNKAQKKLNAEKGSKKGEKNQTRKQNATKTPKKANTNVATKAANKPIPNSKPKSTPKGIDSDRDGTVDTEDKCPGKYGKYTGCPPRHFDEDDFDNDGILDKDDKCSSVSGLEKYKGCPGT